MSDLEVVNEAKNRAIIRAEIAEKKIAELEKDVDYYKQKLEKVVADLDKNKIGRTAYIKGIRTMANALKMYDRVNGAWTDYFERTVDKVLKNLLKEIEGK